MLSPQHREIVKATVPALREHGETITCTFYGNMFAAHPELYNLFNPANQRDGGQARSLAASVLAYATHIDQPERLGGLVERVSNKHGSLQVKPEHYPIVGQYLLGAIQEVLGSAATPEVVEAWGAAYGQLADIMIGRERAIGEEGAAKPGGWSGFKPFRVERKVRESEVTTSFYLVPADGAPLPAFEPGQYLSVRVHPPGFPYAQIRQYSVSCAPNAHYYRISVRREDAPAGESSAPPGLVSNHLHDAVREGDLLPVHMPLGDFTLASDDVSVVLLSGGAGITAVLSMLEHLATPEGGTREVVFLHATRSRAHHAFGEHVRALGRQRPGIRVVMLYEQAGPEDVSGTHHDIVGRIGAEVLRRHLPERGAEFYYCGPLGFMAAVEGTLDQLGVPPAHRHSEAFAPDPSFAADAPDPAPQARTS
jgi:nitric oxide dioxygenase